VALSLDVQDKVGSPRRHLPILFPQGFDIIAIGYLLEKFKEVLLNQES
jgi:hypothetical protein